MSATSWEDGDVVVAVVAAVPNNSSYCGRPANLREYAGSVLASRRAPLQAEDSMIAFPRYRGTGKGGGKTVNGDDDANVSALLWLLPRLLLLLLLLLSVFPRETTEA